MTIPLREDGELIKEVQEKYLHFKKEADLHYKIANEKQSFVDKYAKVLSVMGADVPHILLSNNSENSTKEQPINGSAHKEDSKSPNLVDTVSTALKGQNAPMTLNEIYSLYTAKGSETTKKVLGVRLAQLKNKKFKNVLIAEYPPEFKVWWALPEWFDGDDLKSEYYHRIKEKADRLKSANKTIRQDKLFGDMIQ